MTRSLLLPILASLLSSSSAIAITFIPGPIQCPLGDGHCYQVVGLGGNAGAPYTWSEVSEFASAQVYQDKLGHLLTLDSQTESDSPLVPRAGFLGATGPSNGPYAWAVGPATGDPVTFFGTFVPAPSATSLATCSPYTHLCHSGSEYDATGETLHLPSGVPQCTCGNQFVVEYEVDLVAPQVRVTSPNGGEHFIEGFPVLLTWEAIDKFGGVVGVDLQVSGSGPDGPFEDIALGIANSGTYLWSAASPLAPGTAYLRVTARDAAGNVGSDVSDSGFTIAKSTPAAPSTWGRVKSIYR